MEAHLALMELMHRFGDFRELHTYARGMLPRVTEGPETRPPMEWWASTLRKEAVDDP